MSSKVVMSYERLHERKEKTIITCEEENQKKNWFDHVPRRVRSARRCESSSSSSPSFSPLPVENDISAEKKMKMKNPQTPNSPSSCSSDNRAYKRRALSQGRRNGGFKKAKETAKEMPSWLVQVMKDMNAVNPKLILKKTLSKSDVEPSQARFLIPFNSLIRNDFLTSVDRGVLEEEIYNPRMIGVAAIVIDPMAVRWNMILKMWEMNYSLTCGKTCGWNDIVKANNLKKGDNIDVWSFRRRGILCFALVRSDDY